MQFEEFAAARLPALLRYAMLLGGDREQARDMVQEVLTRALSSGSASPGPMSRTRTCAAW